MQAAVNFCGLTGEDYLAIVEDLLCRGFAWSRDRDSVLMRYWRGVAEEYARISGRDCDLLNRESFPPAAVEMLAEWERALGLPDPCLPRPGSIQERQKAVARKLVSLGGQSKAYYIALAATLGYSIRIEEFRPFRVGINRVGDHLSGGDWVHTWRVVAQQSATIGVFRVGVNSVGDRLRWWGNEALECLLRHVQPAHTNLIFRYKPPPVIKQAAAEISGEGVLDLADRVALKAAAALAGAGVLAADAVSGEAGEAALSGSGALAATAVANKQANADLSGDGAIAAPGVAQKSAAASFAGDGTLQASGVRDKLASAALSGSGTLAADGTRTQTLFVFDLPSMTDLVLRDYANANGYAGQSPATPIFLAGGTVKIGSTSAAWAAIRRGNWPAGVTPKLVLATGAEVTGKGGDGASSTGGATAGGPALDASAGAMIVDSAGKLGGGGGGGGRGQSREYFDKGSSIVAYGGEGGGGAGNQPGAAQTAGSGNNGSNGAATAGGVGGTSQSTGGMVSGAGGNGGGLGQPGNAGGSGTGGSAAGSATSGAAAGAAVIGNANITWINTGTRLGAIT